MLSPSIAHDFELQANGLKLSRGSVANVYCEFFHVFICRNLMGQEVNHFFRRIFPVRRSKRTLISTIVMLIAVIFLINYLLQIVQAG